MKQKIFEIPPSIARQYLIEGEAGYLLIDTGLVTNYTRIKKFLINQSIPIDKIEMVIITHADADHFGCLSLLQDSVPSLVCAASLVEAEAIRKGQSSRELEPVGISMFFFSLARPLFKSSPAQINRILNIGEELPYLGGLEVINSAGHTPGHISLWSSMTRTLFCGDSITIKGNLLYPSTGGNTWNLEKACESFEKQLELQPDRILAGHGTWHRD